MKSFSHQDQLKNFLNFTQPLTIPSTVIATSSIEITSGRAEMKLLIFGQLPAPLPENWQLRNICVYWKLM
ncbi:MAG: hypothetical protein COB93_09440 [Sneathiella sp.]|nr:MAG: hypothetical protein COB93_09440 [Sneathiella sp.]